MTTIINVSKEFDGSYLRVSSDHTLYASHRKCDIINFKDVSSKLTELRSIARKKGVTLSNINKISKFLKNEDNYNSYLYLANTYNNNIDDLFNKWNSHELTSPTVNDLFYTEVLRPLSFQTTAMRYRNTFLSKYEDSFLRIEDAIKSIKENDNFLAIGL